MAGRILVGTSSWADPGFVKEWYPPKMPAKERLPWYAQRFEMVELNSSFYAVPDRNTVHGWVEVTPDGFTFDVKAHRTLSRHSAPVESLPPDLRGLHGTPELERPLAERLVEETAPLRDAGKFGAYLLQLTPAFSPRKHNLEELDQLVEVLGPHGLAVELRNRNWVADERRGGTLDWFADRGVTYVAVDAPPGDNFQIMPPLDAVTNPSRAYLRAHGRNTKGYLTGRSVDTLRKWKRAGKLAGVAPLAGDTTGTLYVPASALVAAGLLSTEQLADGESEALLAQRRAESERDADHDELLTLRAEKAALHREIELLREDVAHLRKVNGGLVASLGKGKAA